MILKTCDPGRLTGRRDRALLLTLLDTGCRASELLSLNVGDVNLDTGLVWVRHGKGDRGRVTFIGKRAMCMLKKHLEDREGA